MTIEVTEIDFLNAYNIDLTLKSDLFKYYLTVSISVAVVKVEVEAILVVVDIISIKWSVVAGIAWDDISLLGAVVNGLFGAFQVSTALERKFPW